MSEETIFGFTVIKTTIIVNTLFDWLEIESSKSRDPEKEYSELLNSTSKNDKIIKKKDFFQSALAENIKNSNKSLAIIDNASISLPNEPELFFKKGSLVYYFDGKFYFRKSDLM